MTGNFGIILAILALLSARPAAAADFVNHLGMAFVTVPAGDFYMGDCGSDPVKQPCPSGDAPLQDHEDSTPQHPVHIAQPFQVQTTPVTGAQLGRFAAARPSRVPKDFFDVQRPADSKPVTAVSWVVAEAFVSWLNTTKPAGDRGRYRLLTEAEWEYAARAGTRTRYSWGDAADAGRCASCGLKDVSDQPVGAFAPNGFGLYDMLGLVWEWTADCWHDDYVGARGDGGIWAGPNDCDRVLRGGYDLVMGPEPNDPLPVTARNSADPFYSSEMLGFRVARTLASDPRDPARLEVGSVITADQFQPPPTTPVALKDHPTAGKVNAVILNWIRSCKAGTDVNVVDDLPPIIRATHPVFRGLPVVDWEFLASGEGEADGPVFAAPLKDVAAAIPEAVAERRFYTGDSTGRTTRRMDGGADPKTAVLCASRNAIHYD